MLIPHKYSENSEGKQGFCYFSMLLPSWYHGAVKRGEAEEVLRGNGASNGLFLVRDCTKHPGSAILLMIPPLPNKAFLQTFQHPFRSLITFS